MPANLPPAYYEAEKRFRAAKTIPEKVAALQEMMSATPKHKGTDHLRADQRSRLARLMADLEKPRATAGGGPQPFSIRKEGAGQAALIGLPNSGKSQLLATLTGASVKVAAYPFSTQVPQPGMLKHQNVLTQLIDTPALNDHDMQTRLFSLLRNADILLPALDLSADPVEQLDEITSELGRWGFRLLDRHEDPDPEDYRTHKKCVIVANKADMDGALDQYLRIEEAVGDRHWLVMTSATEDVGLDQLRESVFAALGKVRVYTRAPGEDPDYDSPIILTMGSNVENAAQSLHRDWKQRLKYALLWGSGKFDAQRVGRDYVLADGDVLEFHG